MPNPISHIGDEGHSAMLVYQSPELKSMVEFYNDGHLTLKELIEELEWQWDKRIYTGTKTAIARRTGRLADAGKAKA